MSGRRNRAERHANFVRRWQAPPWTGCFPPVCSAVIGPVLPAMSLVPARIITTFGCRSITSCRKRTSICGVVWPADAAVDVWLAGEGLVQMPALGDRVAHENPRDFRREPARQALCCPPEAPQSGEVSGRLLAVAVRRLRGRLHDGCALGAGIKAGEKNAAVIAAKKKAFRTNFGTNFCTANLRESWNAHQYTLRDPTSRADRLPLHQAGKSGRLEESHEQHMQHLRRSRIGSRRGPGRPLGLARTASARSRSARSAALPPRTSPSVTAIAPSTASIRAIAALTPHLARP